MAQSFLIFDFEQKEEAAQAARHKLDLWRQAFHLNKKLEYKFDRTASEQEPQQKNAKPGNTAGDKASPQDSEAAEPAEPVRVLVRLSFSDHEKLSHQRWLERLPGEEPFKAAAPKIIRHGDPGFEETAERFDSLD